MEKSVTEYKDYKQWLVDLKTRIRQSQIKAAIRVNTELLNMYWNLGADIVQKQAIAKWGNGFLKQLSQDLTEEFPDMKGFSERNLLYIKTWYLFYNQQNIIPQQVVAELKHENTIIQQVVGQLPKSNDPLFINELMSIPWGHNLLIITKCKKIDKALFYVRQTLENGWSRTILEHQIESDLYSRKGKAVNNFSNTLPAVQSDLAKQLLKDPYNFDFLQLSEPYYERDLEKALTDNITKFLLELGTGFAFVGKQYKLEVGGEDFYIDLLFYHLKLRAYVVVELKTTNFQPEHAGKLNFYLAVADKQLRSSHDNPTIGILICKNKNEVVAEYALQDIRKPIGVSEYELTRFFPKEFKGSLPTIEEIEEKLNENQLEINV